MIKAIIKGIFSLIIKLVNVLLLPIDLAISSLLPDVSNALTSIQQYMYLPLDIFGWVVDLVHVPAIALQLIVAYWVFKYAIITSIAGTRYVIKLYQKFKL